MQGGCDDNVLPLPPLTGAMQIALQAFDGLFDPALHPSNQVRTMAAVKTTAGQHPADQLHDARKCNCGTVIYNTGGCRVDIASPPGAQCRVKTSVTYSLPTFLLSLSECVHLDVYGD